MPPPSLRAITLRTLPGIVRPLPSRRESYGFAICAVARAGMV